MAVFTRVVLCVLLMALADPAPAHTLSESLSSWQIQGPRLHMQFTVPDLEAKRLSDSGNDMPTQAELGQYLAARPAVSAAGAACAMKETALPLSALSGFSRFEFAFECPGEDAMIIHSDIFYDLVSSHTNFAQVETSDGQFSEHLLVDGMREIDLGGDELHGDLASASILKYIEMGIHHIFTGIDHMSFMLGLVLISRRLRDLLLVITGFTLGHSLTLALPVMLLVGGGLFGASYLMLTGYARDAARFRLIMTLVFGLIHGFGFAANLLELQLPKERLAELLVGFNVGVEIGQVSVVLIALIIARALTNIKLAIPRPLFTDLAASFLVAEGFFWFITRSIVI